MYEVMRIDLLVLNIPRHQDFCPPRKVSGTAHHLFPPFGRLFENSELDQEVGGAQIEVWDERREQLKPNFGGMRRLESSLYLI